MPRKIARRAGYLNNFFKCPGYARGFTGGMLAAGIDSDIRVREKQSISLLKHPQNAYRWTGTSSAEFVNCLPGLCHEARDSPYKCEYILNSRYSLLKQDFHKKIGKFLSQEISHGRQRTAKSHLLQ